MKQELKDFFIGGVVFIAMFGTPFFMVLMILHYAFAGQP